jgi:hypothetical protein
MRFSKRFNDQFGIFTPLVNVASIDGSSNGNRLTAANTSVQSRSISSSFWALGSGFRQRVTEVFIPTSLGRRCLPDGFCSARPSLLNCPQEHLHVGLGI